MSPWLLVGLLHADDRGLFSRQTESPEEQLAQSIQAAGFVPMPGLSSTVAPGALVMRSDGAVFLSREDCFPDAVVSESAAALPEHARALSTGLSLSAGVIGRFLGGRFGGNAERTATLSFADLAVRGVSAGALTPSADCLAVLNRQREAGVGLESYLLITEVLQADGVTVQSSSALSAEAESNDWTTMLTGIGGALSITSSSQSGFVASGRVTLGYKCRQLVGHQADGDVDNAGEAEPCAGFGAQ